MKPKVDQDEIGKEAGRSSASLAWIAASRSPIDDVVIILSNLTLRPQTHFPP